MTTTESRPLVRPAAYARSRGYSRQYIGRCLDNGLIRRAIVTVDGRRLLDPTIADEEMAENRPDATSGCWHEARGLQRPRRDTRMDEDSEKLIDDVLVPFALDLFDRAAYSFAVSLREDLGLPAAQVVEWLELAFLLYWRHLGLAIGRPDLALDKDRLPSLIRQLGTKTGRAKLLAALDARLPHPPEETGRRPPRSARRHGVRPARDLFDKRRMRNHG